MSAVANKLREARALIERGWIQGPFATSSDGCSVAPWAKDATCFCTLGATWRVDARDSSMDDILARVVGSSLGQWNDAPGRTQAEVLAAFDKAIELAEQSA